MNKTLEFEYKREKYNIHIKDVAVTGDFGKVKAEVTDKSNDLIVNMTASHALVDYVITQHGGSRESWMRDAAIAEAKHKINERRK